MESIQLASASSLTVGSPAETRSPTPTLPGGWPHTPAHRRTHTCPSLSLPKHPVPSSVTSPDALHLNRVLDFQQRLSFSLLESGSRDDSSPPFIPVHGDDPISSCPSDVSGFTKYTQDGNSSSLADTSIHTSSSEHAAISADFLHQRIHIHSDFDASSYGRSSSPVTDKRSAVGIPKSLSRYETSSGYSTSSDEDYFGPLRTTAGPNSGSTSPLSARLSPAISVAQRVSPSVDDLAPPLVQRLMSFSLPGTPNDSLIDNSFGPTSCFASPAETDTEWTLSLNAMSSTEESISPASPSLSLSPTSSFREQLNLDATEHVVDFPPQASPLTSSAVPSPTIPVHNGFAEEAQENNSLETSAAEYAAAIMSSVWTFDDPPLPPIGLNMPNRDLADTEQDLDSSQGHHSNTTSIQSVPKKTILSKVKKLGGRFRWLLGGKLKNGVAAEMRRPQSVPSIRRTTIVHTSPRLPSLRLDLEESVLPRLTTPRSSIERNRLRRRTPGSHTRTISQQPIILPDIQVLPPTVPNSPETSAPKQPVISHSHQKNLAQIKATRRFSLSAIANLSRQSLPPTSPPILVAPVRRRPVSARLALPTNSRRHEIPAPEHARPSSRTSRLDPPGLDVPSRSGSYSSGSVREAQSCVAAPAIPVTVTAAKTKDLKKSRRFSLPLLSGLSAGGLREDGSSGWTGSSRI